jgi:uncharacterized membrane protein
MPEITALGWFHTFIGIFALVSGFYTLARFKVISTVTPSGQIYLVCTLVAAVTALMIYNQGGFGPAHILAVLTLAALLGGFIVTKIAIFAPIARYLEALCFSVTILFHMIPAITDGLRRLPVGNPVVDRFDDPLLMKFYLLFLALFVVGYAAQVLWLKRNIQDGKVGQV